MFSDQENCVEYDPEIWDYTQDVIQSIGSHYCSDNVFIIYWCCENEPVMYDLQ